MNATRAIVQASLPSRLGMIGATLVLCLGARLLALGEWDPGDDRVFAVMVLELGLLPVFAAMLGGASVRGEHAAWSWGLARPIGRGRLVATSLAIDAVTLGTSIALVRAIVGEVPDHLRIDVFRLATLGWHTLAGSVWLAIFYVTAMLGAARGHTTIRGLPIALAYVVAFAFATSVLVWSEGVVAHLFMIDGWLAEPHHLAFAAEGRLPEGLLDLAAIALALIGGLAHVVTRTIRRLPTKPTRREIAAVFAAWAVGATLVCGSLRSPVAAHAPWLCARYTTLEGLPVFGKLLARLADPDRSASRGPQHDFHPR